MKRIIVIGAGPAGLMCAERLSARGFAVDVYDRMPSPARKFLMAGRGGLNLTHSEPFERFVARYGKAAPRLRPALEAFSPADLRAWADGLGAETFVGSSGRVFPKAMKGSPLLRAWLKRLESQGVRFHLRRRWTGWDGEAVTFDDGSTAAADAVVLALGGASWPKLGSDGGWSALLAARGVIVRPFQPANVGFDAGWSAGFAERFAGTPVKNVALTFGERTVRGEIMLTRIGIEGGAVYAISGALRDAIALDGAADLLIDLRPDLNPGQVASKLGRASAKDSLSNRLRKALNLGPA
ncbi:MAG: TIGR03862 family flavoprotein, partial [Asticcacaulis sp.]|nr:TIGR03862 family flavoprotein [Asticcacaulis sp.]